MVNDMDIDVVKCENCENDSIYDYFKNENIYVGNQWILTKNHIFLCNEHFIHQKTLNNIKSKILNSNQVIINKLSEISNIYIFNTHGTDMIDETEMHLLVNGLKYIKQCKLN